VTARDRIVLLVVLGVAALGGFWMVALKPKRQEAAKLGKDLSSAQQQLDQARSDLQAGQAARSSYAANYTAVARLGKAVPSDDDVPSLVYQLDSTAKATGVDFRSVKLTSGSGTPSTTTAANAAAATSDSAKAGSNGTPGAANGQSAASNQPGANGQPGGDGPAGAQNTAANGQAGAANGQPANAAAGSTPAAPTQTATAALPPGAVVGAAGLSTMPFSFKFTGSFFRLSDFLARLERYIDKRRDSIQVSGRLLLVNGISLQAAQTGFPQMEASISATAYLVPPDEGTFNGATPQAPAGAGGAAAQPASTAPTPSPTAPATVKP
jgi:hypothetical protein